LLVGSKETGLEVNADKPKNMVISRDQNAGRRHNITIHNSSFERVEEFKYLGTTVNQCSIKVKVIPQQAEVAQGVPVRLRPRIFLTFGTTSAIRTGRLYPRRNPWYSFSGAQSTPGHMVPSGGATEKIPSDTTTPPQDHKSIFYSGGN